MITLVQQKTHDNVVLNGSTIDAIIPHGLTAEIVLKNGKTVEVYWGLYEYQKVMEEMKSNIAKIGGDDE